MKRILFIIFALLLTVPTAFASGSVQLTWNPSVCGSIVTGYKVNYGTASGNYTQMKDVGNVTVTVIDGLNNAQSYYFVVTAYDANGNLSDPSNEVYALIPLPPEPAPLPVPDPTPINQNPVIDSFTATPLSGYAPLAVSLVCSAYDPDGAIASYNINPGCGCPSVADSTMQHTYTSSGNYTAICTVTDNNGATTSKTVSVSVLSQPAPTVYTITASASYGGKISPLGTFAVSPKTNKTFYMMPSKNYRVKDVVVDGVSQGAWESWSFWNIEKNHSIRAVFVRKNYYR